jgi:hypothetical protein
MLSNHILFHIFGVREGTFRISQSLEFFESVWISEYRWIHFKPCRLSLCWPGLHVSAPPPRCLTLLSSSCTASPAPYRLPLFGNPSPPRAWAAASDSRPPPRQAPPLSFFSCQHADTPTPMPTPSPLLPENIQQTKNIKPFKAQPSLESATAVTGWYNLLISPNNTSPQTVQFIHIILHNMYDGIWAWSYNCSLFSLNAYK